MLLRSLCAGLVLMAALLVAHAPAVGGWLLGLGGVLLGAVLLGAGFVLGRRRASA